MAIVKEPEFAEAVETTDADQQLQIPNDLPVLPLRDIVIYPFMIVPLFVSREKSIRAVDEALGENRMILLASQKDLDKEEPTADDLYSVGTAAVIMRMLKLPDGRIRILVQGLARARMNLLMSGEYLRSRVNVIQEIRSRRNVLSKWEALVRNVRGSMEKAINLGKNISPEVMAIIANLDDAGRLADLSASNLELKVEDAQSVLDIADTTARLRRVNELPEQEIEVLTVQQEINTQARADIDRSQRSSTCDNK
jgi:ATP-dependent Lon protease